MMERWTHNSYIRQWRSFHMCRPNQTTIKINTYFSSAPFLAHMIDNTYTMLYIQKSKVKGQRSIYTCCIYPFWWSKHGLLNDVRMEMFFGCRSNHKIHVFSKKGLKSSSILSIKTNKEYKQLLILIIYIRIYKLIIIYLLYTIINIVISHCWQ